MKIIQKLIIDINGVRKDNNLRPHFTYIYNLTTVSLKS
jgi:hypothetical protein